MKDYKCGEATAVVAHKTGTSNGQAKKASPNGAGNVVAGAGSVLSAVAVGVFAML